MWSDLSVLVLDARFGCQRGTGELCGVSTLSSILRTMSAEVSFEAKDRRSGP